MSYTDPDTVRVALTPGGDDADLGSAASMSDDDLQSAIDDAQVEVDARLSTRYTVPFTSPVPALVAQVTTDIAAYLATLTARRGDPILAGDPVALRNARAVVLLGQLQTGAAVLPGSNPAAEGSEAMPVWTDPDADYLPTYGLTASVCDRPTLIV